MQYSYELQLIFMARFFANNCVVLYLFLLYLRIITFNCLCFAYFLLATVLQCAVYEYYTLHSTRQHVF